MFLILEVVFTQDGEKEQNVKVLQVSSIRLRPFIIMEVLQVKYIWHNLT